jgi:hypothetical protein
MLQDDIELEGRLTFELIEDGEVVERQVEKNAIVDDGRNNILRAIGNLESINTYVYLAVGTDGTSVTDSDSALGTEVERIALDDGNNEYTHDAGAVEISGEWTFSESQANSSLAEAGLFSASSGGTMLNRTVISPTIDKSSSQKLRITWTLNMG